MAILKESQIIGNYTVQSFIKEGLYNETYRISDKELLSSTCNTEY